MNSKRLFGIVFAATITTVILGACNNNPQPAADSDKQSAVSQDQASTGPVSSVSEQEASLTITESPDAETNPSTEELPKYTMEEIAAHNMPEDCWTAIDGKVYDLTGFIALGQHNDKILNGCGIDSTQMFTGNDNHMAPDAQSTLSRYIIGTL